MSSCQVQLIVLDASDRSPVITNDRRTDNELKKSHSVLVVQETRVGEKLLGIFKATLKRTR